MKIKLVIAVSVVAAGLAFAAGKVWAERAAAAPAAPAEPQPQAQTQNTGLELIGSSRDTLVYYINYQGHSCFIASSRGGAGVSLQCQR